MKNAINIFEKNLKELKLLSYSSSVHLRTSQRKKEVITVPTLQIGRGEDNRPAPPLPEKPSPCARSLIWLILCIEAGLN